MNETEIDAAITSFDRGELRRILTEQAQPQDEWVFRVVMNLSATRGERGFRESDALSVLTWVLGAIVHESLVLLVLRGDISIDHKVGDPEPYFRTGAAVPGLKEAVASAQAPRQDAPRAAAQSIEEPPARGLAALPPDETPAPKRRGRPPMIQRSDVDACLGRPTPPPPTKKAKLTPAERSAIQRAAWAKKRAPQPEPPAEKLADTERGAEVPAGAIARAVREAEQTSGPPVYEHAVDVGSVTRICPCGTPFRVKSLDLRKLCLGCQRAAQDEEPSL